MYLNGGPGSGKSYSGDGIQGYLVLSSGGQTSQSWGIAVSYNGLIIYVIVQTKDQLWGPIQFTAPSIGWYYITMVWSYDQGLILYINGQQFQKATSISRDITISGSQYNDFLIGKPNDIDDSYGKFQFDDFFFTNTAQTSDWVSKQYSTYPAGKLIIILIILYTIKSKIE